MYKVDYKIMTKIKVYKFTYIIFYVALTSDSVYTHSQYTLNHTIA